MVRIGPRRRPFGRVMAERFGHPAKIVVGGFGTAIAFGTLLLSTPWATASGRSAHFIDALFTATSAVCVTGLITVDTGTYWSSFGQIVILLLIQIGGLGIMTLATLIAVLVSRRLRLRAQLVAQAETKTLQLRDVRRVIRNIVLFSLISELVVAVVLTTRFVLGYGFAFGPAVYDGVFHAISAFNNAGFSLNEDSLMRYVSDPWVNLTVMAAIVLGGLGFPVVFELARRWRRPAAWSVLTRITVWVTVTLLVAGAIVFTAVEWGNPRTLGALGDPAKIMAGLFQSVTSRTAGFNTIDTAQMRSEGWFATDILMFIGGGSAGTAGGIKVTTFGLLAFVIWAELRGETHVNIGHRRLAEPVQRQALTIALMGVALVATATFALHAITPYKLDQVLFEAVSAFGTVGLSTGITQDEGRAAHLLIVVLMFAGRLGPLTLGTALALRERTRRYELPEERPIVG